MSGPLLRHQADVSAVVPMPVDRVDDASTVTAVSGETLTWFYVTSSAWASATGQAAGTIVTGKLAFTGVLNSMKSAVGSYNDTSLSFAAATRAETKVSIPENVVSQLAFMSPTDQAATVAIYLTTAGYYFIDHRRGQIWLKSKDTVVNDSVSYSYMAPVFVNSGAASGTPAVGNPVQVGGVYNSSAPTLDDGDVGALQLDVQGNLKVTLATGIAGESLSEDVLKTETQMNFTNITASALIKSGTGRLGGWVVNSASAGASIKFWNQTSAAIPVMHNTVTYTAAVDQGTQGTTVPGAAGRFTNGLYATISGTMDVTIYWV